MSAGTEFGRIRNRKGTYAALLGTTPESISLSPSTDLTVYEEFNVIKDIPNVQNGTVAPWFDMPGGGHQYNLPISIEELIKGGFITPK